MTPRERAVAWAQGVAADPAAVFLDTETTGLGPEAELCDIAIVGIDGRVLLDSLVLPLGPIPAESVAVHGITIGLLDRAKAPMWADLWPRVATILHPGRRVIVYNRDYDLGIINQVNRAAKLAEFPRVWDCAMLAYGDYDGTPSDFGRGMKWHKLSLACEAMGVTLDGAHRALADAEATRRLVRAMAGEAPEVKPAEFGQLAMFGTLATD